MKHINEGVWEYASKECDTLRTQVTVPLGF